MKMTEDGDVVLKGGGKSEYLRPQNLREVAGCLHNWRSAWARLWPWSYEAEVFMKIMDDYCYLQVSLCNLVWFLFDLNSKFVQFAKKKRGQEGRIKLIEKLFADVSRHNAHNAWKPPLTYDEVRSILSGILTAAGVPDYTPTASLAFDELEWNFNSEVSCFAVCFYFCI